MTCKKLGDLKRSHDEYLKATRTFPILPVDPRTIRMNMAMRKDL